MNRKNWVQYVTVAITMIVIILCGTARPALASGENSYNYDIWGKVEPVPAAYELEKSIRAKDIGLDSMVGLTDIYYRNNRIYISMTGKVVVLDESYQLVDSITTYQKGNKEDVIKAPMGIFVTEDNQLYVCEQDAGVILQFDENLKFVRELGDPKITGLNYKYAPSRVVVDDVGRIYVKANSVYEGIIELTPDGQFNRFIGANEVKPSFTERMYRMIATEQQIARMQLWLPTDYSDIAIDQDGFIYATVNDTSSSEPVRKLNSAGQDVMPELEFEDRPRGDFKSAGSISKLISVTCAEDGRFAVLDSNFSKVFVYSQDSHLMYVLGGSGSTRGTLNSPVGITFMGDDILVIDLVTQSIEVFSETHYGTLINEGLRAENKYEYEEAASKWDQVLKMNSKFYYANLGIGRYQMRNGMYEEAMENFEKAGKRSYYSLVYEKVRADWIDTHFNQITAILALIISIFIGFKVYRHYRKPKGETSNKAVLLLKKMKQEWITYPLQMMSTPFKVFDDMKRYNEGSVVMATIFCALFAWSGLIRYKYCGFLVIFANTERTNVFTYMISMILPYIIFVIGNWAVGVLIDGKGEMRNIYKVISYSLYPMIWCNLIGTILSNVVTENEAALVSGLFTIGMIFFIFYAFVGLVMVQQFSFTKNVASIVLTFVAMMIIMFISLLLVTLLSGFISDIWTIIKELQMRF